MGEYKDILNALIDDIAQFKEINPSDIPSIDLYMDQVTTFFEDKLGYLKRDEEDKILTKTMINNYAKADIITPIKKKKYNREQIMLLTLIYHLKQVISLNDISMLFAPLIQDKGENKEGISIEDIYSLFLDFKKEQIEKFNGDMQLRLEIIKDKAVQLGKKDTKVVELLILAFMLITQAELEKRMTEKIVDTFFNGQNT